MSRFSRPLAIAGAILAFVFTAGSAYAQSDHTWVSSTGGGTACTRASPCADFPTAYAATNAGGVMSVVDSGDFGIATITIKNRSLSGPRALTPIGPPSAAASRSK